MITHEEKELIKQVIGKRSLSAIHQYFIRHNIVKANGKPYSKSHISNVLNGGVPHEIIEEGIAKAALHYHKQSNLKAKAKKDLMQALKPKEDK
ncbi:MAG: hypothetical protein KTR22_02310 [Flavobacteriaceae bacterium]|nr:hypothetical protein [Flavobacteriaceae bacterium]